MDNWRKIVEWDNVIKVYRYKDFCIIPLSNHEQIEMPTHLQNEYYWSEIEHIDRIINEEKKQNKRNRNYRRQ